jgi:hypothetical protein
MQQELNYALELAIVNYLNGLTGVSGSLLSSSNATFFTGLNNVDMNMSPLVIVDCYDTREVIFDTNVYELSVKIGVFEMSADTLGSSAGGTGNPLGTLAGAVFNEFLNSYSASYNVSSASLASTASHINVWQCNKVNGSFTREISDDAVTNIGDFKFIGASVP